MYLERRHRATQRGGLHLLELSVALDKFLCAAAGEADREFAVFIVPFDADNGAHQIAGDFRKKARGQGSAESLLVAKDAAVNSARQRQGSSGAGHTDVNEAPLFFNAFIFVERATVRADALFEAGQKHVIEFEA